MGSLRITRRSRQQGASLIEYALVLAFVVAVATVVLGTGGGGTLGTAIQTKATGIANSLNN